MQRTRGLRSLIVGVWRSDGTTQPTLAFCTHSGDESRPKSISIDRSGLFNAPEHSHGAALNKEPETKLTKILKALIREALTNPSAGYYMQRDVFGKAGDFVTSPEISQLFGEMVGVWCADRWQQIGSPKKLNIVEIGPGRGTLMADLLRGTSTLRGFADALEVCLVEVSRPLRKLQQKILMCNANGGFAESARTDLTNAQVTWHDSLASVPTDAPAIFIAHELFDALPAHQFQRLPGGSWRERLIDVAPDESPLHFQMVLAPTQTPAAKLLLDRRLKQLSDAERDALMGIEISPQSMVLAQELGQRVESQGGAALIVDYGREGPYPGSLQAIKDHRFVHFLSSPGAADLSCRVDLSAIRHSIAEAGAQVAVHGPIPQAHFLAGLGIEARLDMLLDQAPEGSQSALIEGFNRLVSWEEQPSKSALLDSGQDSTAQEEKPNDVGTVPDESYHASHGLSGASKDTLGAEEVVFEGMGMTYQAMAITPRGQPPPLPFPGSGIEFQ